MQTQTSPIENTINKILTAMTKRDDRIELLQKFANSQNILKQYGYKNVLLLARQAHLNKMKLNDVRAVAEWGKINISPLILTQPLTIIKEEVINGEIIYSHLKAYDVTHTNATQQGIIPRETIVKVEEGDEQRVYGNLLLYAKDTFDVKITDSNDIVTNGYYPYSKTITINKSNDPIDNINHLINKLYIETIYGEQIRDYSRFIQDDTLETGIAKIITNSFLNRMSIAPELVDNRLTFNEAELIYQNLPQTLETISNHIRQFDKKLQISQFINENFHIYDELYQHKKEFDEKLEKLEKIAPTQKTQETYTKKPKIERTRMTDDEAKRLRDRTKEEITTSDPKPILDMLGLEITTLKPNEYVFKARVENTASAGLKLKNGVWLYNDFGCDSKGTILNLVQEITGKDWKEARQMCCDTLGVTDHWQIRKDEIDYEDDLKKIKAGYHKMTTPETKKPKKTTDELLKESEERIKALRLANLELERLHAVNSKVTFVSKTIPSRFIKWLKEERGITDTQLKGFYYIKGETWQTNDFDIAINIKKNEGVGVLCANTDELATIIEQVETQGSITLDLPYSSEQTIGADVHFPPYSFINNKGEKQTNKTLSFGSKKNSTFIDNQGAQTAIIESKMDYAAAAQQINFQKEKINIDIANSVNNADMVADNISKTKPEKLLFLNQFDAPGVKFIIDIVNKTAQNGYKIDKFEYIDYAINEYKQDINDLVKKGIKLEERTKIGTLKDLSKLLDKIEQNETAKDKIEEIKKIKEYLSISCDTPQPDKKAKPSQTLK